MMILSSLRIPKRTRVPFMMSFLLGWKSCLVLKSVETGVVDSLVVPVPKSGDSQETGLPDSEDLNESSSNVEHKTEPHSDFPHVEDLREKKVKNQFPAKDIADLTPEKRTVPIQEKDLPPYPHISTTSSDSGTSCEGNTDMKDQEAIPKAPLSYHVKYCMQDWWVSITAFFGSLQFQKMRRMTEKPFNWMIGMMKTTTFWDDTSALSFSSGDLHAQPAAPLPITRAMQRTTRVSFQSLH
ncbi:hypothetical protein PVL29_021555 [Vitis rotundifolia]|uniref:Uncharacterized protein n=1 Tax=Vitis rotundifolia TaxID=103349 RepID=A0AA39DD46_VITRO|nr:hypothetical protein PVL29_021555 [Vitis rotundifolia]